MSNDQILRQQLLALLRGGHAHMSFEHVVDNFPIDHINTHPPNFPYTPWQLLEHMRIAQWDILDFIQNPDYIEPNWPDDYWPAEADQADPRDWQNSVDSFRSDLEALITILEDPRADLYASLHYGEKYNILREILIVADHNAYHLGELAAFREILST
jgi:hypothetical protein